jgi:hypothetical protein
MGQVRISELKDSSAYHPWGNYACFGIPIADLKKKMYYFHGVVCLLSPCSVRPLHPLLKRWVFFLELA